MNYTHPYSFKYCEDIKHRNTPMGIYNAKQTKFESTGTHTGFSCQTCQKCLEMVLDQLVDIILSNNIQSVRTIGLLLL